MTVLEFPENPKLISRKNVNDRKFCNFHPVKEVLLYEHKAKKGGKFMFSFHVNFKRRLNIDSNSCVILEKVIYSALVTLYFHTGCPTINQANVCQKQTVHF